MATGMAPCTPMARSEIEWVGPVEAVVQSQMVTEAKSHVEKSSQRALDWESGDPSPAPRHLQVSKHLWGCSHRLLQADGSCGSLSHGLGPGGPGHRLLGCLLFLPVLYPLLFLPETAPGAPFPTLSHKVRMCLAIG